MGKRTNTAKWMENQSRWQVNVQKDTERRSFYSSIPGRNGQRECNAKADAWLDDNISDSNIKISTLFDDYMETLKLKTSTCNWRPVRSIGDKWIIPRIGDKKIAKLNEQNLQDIIDKAFSTGLSKKTILNIRAVIVTFLKYCRKRSVTMLHPEDLVIPKGARLKEKNILQPADLKVLFSVDTTILADARVYDSYINAFRFQVLTGLRPGELVGLKQNDIKGGTIYLRRSINYIGDLTNCKNENAIRTFTLSDLAVRVLKDQLERCPDSEYLFGISSQATYEKRLERYCTSNNITRVTPYELRHTFVSITKEMPEGLIKPLVGHAKDMDTLGTYGHQVNGELAKTAKQINSIFSKVIKSGL